MGWFRKKPVLIEAMQYTYPASAELRGWMGKSAGSEQKQRHPKAKGELHVVTLEDGSDGRVSHVATEGDWIIRGVQGEFYPCKPDIFQQTYEGAQPAGLQNTECGLCLSPVGRCVCPPGEGQNL